MTLYSSIRPEDAHTKKSVTHMEIVLLKMWKAVVVVVLVCSTVYGFEQACPIGRYRISSSNSGGNFEGEVVVTGGDGKCCSSFFFSLGGYYCDTACTKKPSLFNYLFQNGDYDNRWSINLGNPLTFNWLGLDCLDWEYRGFLFLDDTVELTRFNKCFKHEKNDGPSCGESLRRKNLSNITAPN
jgi:hypothetical protein